VNSIVSLAFFSDLETFLNTKQHIFYLRTTVLPSIRTCIIYKHSCSVAVWGHIQKFSNWVGNEIYAFQYYWWSSSSSMFMQFVQCFVPVLKWHSGITHFVSST